MRSKLQALIAVAAVALLAVSCGESVDRDGTVDLLVENGVLTRAQAECYLDGAIDELGEDRLIEVEKNQDYNDAELEVLEGIQLRCIEDNPEELTTPG